MKVQVEHVHLILSITMQYNSSLYYSPATPPPSTFISINFCYIFSNYVVWGDLAFVNEHLV